MSPKRVGRVTPCAPFGKLTPVRGAHGVTRPTMRIPDSVVTLLALKREKATLRVACTFSDWRTADLAGVFSRPIAQADAFFYLAAFVAMFLGFGWTVFHAAEGMFRVADEFSDCI